MSNYPAHFTDQDKLEAYEKEFWSKVDKKGQNECWEWQGHLDKRSGRGRCKLHRKRTKNGNPAVGYAYRVAYELEYKRPIADGLVLLHLCNNPACVNPLHLTDTTQSMNIQKAHDEDRFPKRNSKIEAAMQERGVTFPKFQIKELAEAKGMTISSLADEINLPDTNIRRFWHNTIKSTCHQGMLALIADALECHISDLYR